MKHLSILTSMLICFFMLPAQTNRYSVVINEILADPSPVVGLPNTEFVELRNMGKIPVNLFKWKISNGSTTATISTTFMLGPDSLVTICSKTQSVFFTNPSTTLGITSFPALTNDGDVVSLISPEGIVVHAVRYDLSDYHNSLKSEGGWSLEMIDPYRPCDKFNLTASMNYAGGTPGKENSVFKPNGKERSALGLQCIALDPTHLLISADQGMDSAGNVKPSLFISKPEQLNIASVSLVPPVFDQISIQLKEPLKDHTTYAVTANGIRHCNSMLADTFVLRTGIIHDAQKDSLIINEVLFDPPSGGADFIELFNNSRDVFNAKNIHVTNRNIIGTYGNIYQGSSLDRNIFPGDYYCISTDTAFIKHQWAASDKSNLAEVKILPSLPDDSGDLVLLNMQGELVDEFKYDDAMHFPLLREKEGVSLERMNPNKPSNAVSNWHSASSSVNYGTPGYINSQQALSIKNNNAFNIYPDVISPNNDGMKDFLTIHYSFKNSGFMTSVFLFNDRGILLHKIADNQLCGKDGVFIWDGTINQRKCAQGIYYILLEAYHLNGERERKKWSFGIE